MLEQKTVTKIDERCIWEYTTDELKNILGNFEEEYNSHMTGEVIHNAILGFVNQGTIDHALEIGAITRRKFKNRNNDEWFYYVKLPEYYDYQLKYGALRELISRREYANENG